jgi:hypothetical protein
MVVAHGRYPQLHGAGRFVENEARVDNVVEYEIFGFDARFIGAPDGVDIANSTKSYLPLVLVSVGLLGR